MKQTLARIGAILLLGFSCSAVDAQSPPTARPKGLSTARSHAWQVVMLVNERFKGADNQRFPGIEQWQAEFARATKGVDFAVLPESWPAVDIDALVTHSSSFWRAYFEVTPGDPGMALLHAGLLLSAGEAQRAERLLRVCRHSPGMSWPVVELFERLETDCLMPENLTSGLLAQGRRLTDQGEYPAALAKFQQALDIWPQDGAAHFRYGRALRAQQWTVAGLKLPDRRSAFTSGPKPSTEILAAFAKAKQHEPLTSLADEGEDPALVAALMPIEGFRAWQQVGGSGPATVESLIEFAEACQEASQHELALATRQVILARRKQYEPSDQAFISKSLRELAPGKPTDAALERLASAMPAFHQIIVTEASK